MKITPHAHRGKVELVPLHRDLDSGLGIYFLYQRRKYLYDPMENTFVKVKCKTNYPYGYFKNWSGFMKETDVSLQKAKYGSNKFEVALPSFLDEELQLLLLTPSSGNNTLFLSLYIENPTAEPDHLVRKPVAVTQNQVASKSPVFHGLKRSIKLTTVVTTSAVRDSVFERVVHRHKHSSLQLAHRVEVPTPYGERRSVASRAPLVRTAPKDTASTALCRCSRPTAGTGITISSTASEANACARR